MLAIEYPQIPEEWNNTTSDYPLTKCIHQLFEEQVQRTPDAVAVAFKGQYLTYSELDAKANQLAHHLQSVGIGSEVLVGVCMERSLENIVGIVGIWKAGGAYVPLDPKYPKERLAFMLKDSKVKIVLTNEKFISGLIEPHGVHIICIDKDIDTSQKECKPPISKVNPDNLAYVIYTSGSTGTPKGVMNIHRGLSNLAKAQVKAFDVHAQDIILQVASFSFDVSIGDIVTALCSGAVLHLGEKDAVLAGHELLRLLRKYEITHVELTPSVLASMPFDRLPALRTIVVGGEPCSPELAAKWSKNRKFINAYGPTECTVCASLAEYTGESTVLPIGRPIANTQLYILDRQLQPVSVGTPGEICISGAGVARGYLYRPELTAERFIKNPFSKELDSRLYKTGDLAKYRSDGKIEFVGRTDHQIKLRGFRIEPGEIETALAQHSKVRQTAVIVREDTPGDKRLVAYVVLDGQVAKQLKLRHYLQRRVPAYMIPSAFIILPMLPLTPNGKIDRHALSVSEMYCPELEMPIIKPQTKTEQYIATIWQDVLHLKAVGIHDNFFELGGDSLLLVRIHHQLSDRFKDLLVVDLFRYPTIYTLAQYLKQTQKVRAMVYHEKPTNRHKRRTTLPQHQKLIRKAHRNRVAQNSENV